MNPLIYVRIQTPPTEEPGTTINQLLLAVSDAAPDLSCHACEISIATPPDPLQPKTAYLRLQMRSATLPHDAIVALFERLGYSQSSEARQFFATDTI